VTSVAVLGAGPVGCAAVAYLQERGHRVALWSPTGQRINKTNHGTAEFQVEGALHKQVSVPWLSTLETVRDYDHIVICLPATCYEVVLNQLIPVLRDGQIILISGALSLVGVWLAHQSKANVMVGSWNTTPTTAHFLAQGRVHVNALRAKVGLSSARAEHKGQLTAASAALFDCQFEWDEHPVKNLLRNINPIAHAAEVIPNLTRINLGEAWPLFGCFDEVVERIAEVLDDERLSIAQAMGFSIPSLAEHYHRSYHVPLGPLHEMTTAIDEAGFGPLGPQQLAHRYVLEDMPFGLAVQERIAQRLGLNCTLHTTCLTLLETVYQRSLRDNYLLAAVFDNDELWDALNRAAS